jgi:hypothetical protein
MQDGWMDGAEMQMQMSPPPLRLLPAINSISGVALAKLPSLLGFFAYLPASLCHLLSFQIFTLHSLFAHLRKCFMTKWIDLHHNMVIVIIFLKVWRIVQPQVL